VEVRARGSDVAVVADSAAGSADLGGDGAEAIALATIAEIQACCEGKLGHSRRMTPQFVLEQIALGGSSRYLQCAQ